MSGTPPTPPSAAETLPVVRAGAIAAETALDHWLIRSIWGRAAVGIVGGAPKCCKSWLGLDMAVSVASGTPCLDRFAVDAPGPSLVFLAEDALPMVRSRIDALCRHRGLDIASLDLHVITAPVLRLDLQKDQARLLATVLELKPRLLLLDPLVRLHRLDENSASEISGLLGFLRELQRAADVAVVLVHHASKKQRARPGQTLRGSSDLHAFGDCNAYLGHRADGLVLTLEHRAAQAPEPMPLALVSRPDGTATHLALKDGAVVPAVDTAAVLSDAIRDLLKRAATGKTRQDLRAELRVNNERLGQALTDLEAHGTIARTAQGWTLVAPAAGRPPQQVLALELA